MAANPLYENQIASMLNGNYTGTPGYQFARDQGINASLASNSAQRGSGNVLAELTRLGSGYAAQDYGNQLGRLTTLNGQAQQYDLGQGQNANTAQANANTAQRNAWDYTLGQGQNANNRQTADQNFGLGMYTAGNNAQNNWWQNQNQQQANDTNWQNANTNWYNAQANNANNQNRNNMGWWNALGS